MKKKLISLLMAIALLFTLAPAALAADVSAAGTSQSSAEALYTLGLFKGTGLNDDGTPKFELDRSLTREEAVTMLVRLLGKDSAALSESHSIPFTDVSGWAVPYVSYAYSLGYTNGTGETTFGGNETVTASQYITFVLRALGYESGKDFIWDSAWTLSDPLGLTKGQYNANSTFIRADTAEISLNALNQTRKGSTKTLLSLLLTGGAVTNEKITAAGLEEFLNDKEARFAAFPAVPDFGAFFGISPLAANTSNGLGMYIYNKGLVTDPDALKYYKAVLEKWGFSYHGTFEGPETSGYLYISGDMSEVIYFGTIRANQTENFAVMIFSADALTK